MKLEVITTGAQSPSVNMEKDQRLLESLAENPRPILHLYEWEQPSATYGYFSNPEKLLNSESIAFCSLKLAKRPTGGGITFHEFDLAFSLLVPASHPHFSLNTLANYTLVNSIVAEVLKPYLQAEPLLQQIEKQNQKDPLCNFCMSSVTIYDVVVEGKKVAGAAQRKTKDGFLHQGSICLQRPPDKFLEEIFLPGPSFANAMRECSYPLTSNASAIELANIKQRLREDLTLAFRQRLEG